MPDPPTRTTWNKYEQHALLHEGNSGRGKKLFRDGKRTKCLTCHKVQSEGGVVGPDLSYIAGKFDRPHLIESLLEPSRQIVEEYRSTVIVRRDGRVEIGIVEQRSDRDITLVDASGNQRVIARDEIDEHEFSSVSLMPVGLADALTPAEFTDLIAYLETLRSGGKLTPGASVAGPIKLPAGFEVQTIATGLRRPSDLRFAPNGSLYILLRNAWVIDDKFQPGTGSLLKISYFGQAAPTNTGKTRSAR